ncbi:MAG: radical SAM protein [Candidatus Desulfofervidaceae bacterium]|nr:radical SAM protein [Candidatus Desulfofervidaceae bacterium]
MKKPRLLLINPWIYDFAAHDYWAKPLGLLYIASWLRANGCHVDFIDCLNVHHPQMAFEPHIKHATRRANGTGKFYRQRIPKPAFFTHIPRHYYRYGLTYRLFWEELNKLPPPDVIIITSGMTYWYPGVFAVIHFCKQKWPQVPITLGGIYATLCYEHACQYSQADFVVKGPAETTLPSLLEQLTGIKLEYTPKMKYDPDLPYPAFDLLPQIDYVCILTSRGCPFRCEYCASRLLFSTFYQRPPEDVFKEIIFWHTQYGIKEFAFYDDALLVNAETHAVPLFNMIIKSKINVHFHTPNGLHARFITPKVAKIMFQAGVKTVRLGLETASPKRHDQKLTREEFIQAVHYLHEVGFTPSQIGSYILIGLPGQTKAEVEETIVFAQKLGITPRLAEYSPIPGTKLWPEALQCSQYDLANEPLTHNNSILPCAHSSLSWEDIKELKKKLAHLLHLSKKCAIK